VPDTRQPLPEVCRRYWSELWAQGRVEVIDEIYQPTFVRHHGNGSDTTTRSEYVKRFGEFQRVLHRPETTVDDHAISGDTVWMRATSRGLNKETGEMSTVTWLVVQRLENDRIAEQWVMTAAGVDWRAAGAP
jgi:predicted SnoaL-like aldol condensation-catalyzing enzyme